MPENIKSHIDVLEKAGVNIESPENLHIQIHANKEIIQKAVSAVRKNYQEFLTRNLGNNFVNKVATFVLATVFEMENIKKKASYQNYKEVKKTHPKLDELILKVRNLLELPEFDTEQKLQIEQSDLQIPSHNETEGASKQVLKKHSESTYDSRQSVRRETDLSRNQVDTTNSLAAKAKQLEAQKKDLKTQIDTAQSNLYQAPQGKEFETTKTTLQQKIKAAQKIYDDSTEATNGSISKVKQAKENLQKAVNDFNTEIRLILDNQKQILRQRLQEERNQFLGESLSGVGQNIDMHLQNAEQLLHEWQEKHDGHVLKWIRADYYMSLVGAENQVSFYIKMLINKITELKKIKQSFLSLKKLNPEDLAITTELFQTMMKKDSSMESKRKNYITQVKAAIPFFVSPYGRLYLSQVSAFNSFKKDGNKVQALELNLVRSQVQFSIELLESMENYLPASAISKLGKQLIARIPNITKEQKRQIQAEVDRQYSYLDRFGEFAGNWMTIDWAAGTGVIKGATLLSKFSLGQKILTGGTKFATATRAGQMLSKGAGGVGKFLEYTPKMFQTTEGAGRIMNGSKFILDLGTKFGRVALPMWGLNQIGAPREIQEALIAVLIICPAGQGLATVLERNMVAGGGKITPMAAKELEAAMAEAVQKVEQNPEQFEKAAKEAGLWEKIKDWWLKIRINSVEKSITQRGKMIKNLGENLGKTSLKEISAVEKVIEKELVQIKKELSIEGLPKKTTEALNQQREYLRKMQGQYKQRKAELEARAPIKPVEWQKTIKSLSNDIEKSIKTLKEITYEQRDNILALISNAKSAIQKFEEYLVNIPEKFKEKFQKQLESFRAKFKEAERQAKEKIKKKSENELSPATHESIKSSLEIRKLFEKLRHDKRQPQLTRDLLLRDERLIPKEMIIIDGQKFYMGNILQTPRRYQQAVVFVEKKGKMIPRVFYKSRSDGGWRSCPGMEGSAYSKGRHIHYTQETKPHKDIIDYFERNKSNVLHYEVDIIDRKFSRFEPEVHEIDTYNKEIYQYNDGGVLRGPQQHMPGECFNDWKNFDLNKFIRDCNNLPNGFVPDFRSPKFPPKKVTHTELTPHTGSQVTLEIFESRLNGRPVEWHIMYDVEGRVWIDRICFSNGRVNSYGVASEIINTGGLTNKPFEYASQLIGLDKLPRSIFPRDRIDKYIDITPILDMLNPIQQFRKARGIWRKKTTKKAA